MEETAPVLQMRRTVKAKREVAPRDSSASKVHLLNLLREENKNHEKKKRLFLKKIYANKKKIEALKSRIQKEKVEQHMQCRGNQKRGIGELIQRNKELLRKIGN